MQHNTAVSFVYRLLGKGVHLAEIQRFAESATHVDPEAETIPAPPPLDFDPDERPTIPAPRPADFRPSVTARTMSELLDMRGAPAEFWTEVEGLVECGP